VSEKTLTEKAVDSGNGQVEETATGDEATNETQSTSEETIESVVEAAAEPAEPEAVPSLETQLEAAKAEAARNLDGWMRVQAEFANVRKRMEKQRAETYVNATADVATRLLPVLDDFGRALHDVPDELAEHSWVEGMKLVQRKLLTIIEGLNVTPIKAVGEPFDPNFHEAIMQEASDEYESGVVTKELQPGYRMGDRVIRPSLVYVAE
jgi:molecular chaperone GrpE